MNKGASETPDYYRTLGVNISATPDELRRAYRILARRYHPDVNPGASSAERFTAISTAYETLSDPERRKSYDAERSFQRNFDESVKRRAHTAAYRNAEDRFRRTRTPAAAEEERRKAAEEARSGEAARPRAARASGRPADESPLSPNSFFLKSPKVHTNSLSDALKKVSAGASKFFLDASAKRPSPPSLTVIEVSLSIREALFGGKKSIELPEAPGEEVAGKTPGTRKLSLVIPSGTRSGSTLQLRSKRDTREEVLVIFRVSAHPFISIEGRGVIVDLNLSLSEALQGATMLVPTLDEPVMLKIPPATSSGQELRLKGKGVLLADGSRGDLFYRALIKLPAEEGMRNKLAASISGAEAERTGAGASAAAALRNYLPKYFDELR